MSLNAQLVGKTYPPQAFRVEAARAAAFAAAVGHERADVPPTFVTAAEFAMLADVIADRELGLDYARVVHGEQEYEWGRVLRAGETLTAETTIDDIRAKGGLEMLTIRTELRDETGRPVVVSRNTLIVRAGA